MKDFYRPVGLLAICQAMFMTGNSLVIATSALVGLALAPDPRWSTVPLGIQFTFVFLSTYPASLLMKAMGRRYGLMVGAAVGVLAASVCAVSIHAGSFAGFCAGCALLGVFNAFGQYYRFAAADCAPPEDRALAISAVMAGGVIAAFTGPALARYTKDAMGPGFALSYASIVALAAVSLALLSLVRVPRSGALEHAGPQRTLLEVGRDPQFFTAVICATVGYGVMNMLMTSTPLAMSVHGFGFAEMSSVIQWHIFGMFFPSFFTGSLIKRFGVERILLTGAVLIIGAILVNLAGSGLVHFWIALFSLGVGWNFLFLGGTTLVTMTHSASEKARVQGLNDVLVFGTVALTATTSGLVHATLGWAALNYMALVPTLAALVACVLLIASKQEPRGSDA